MLLVAACTDRAPPPPASAASGTTSAAASAAGGRTSAAGSALANRIWLRTSPAPPLGSMLVFLSDGTLLQDSCGETYRLSRWRADSVDELRWQEDTAEIKATVVKLTQSELTLSLDLVGGPEVSTYVAAAVPYVCPDLPR